MYAYVFIKPVTWILDGVKNLAILRKAPVKKAARLSLDTIRKKMERVIIPYVSTPERAEAKQLRTVFRVTLVYYKFCRFNCFSKLRVENFLSRGTEIEVFFPQAKNDVKYRGNITKMVQNGLVPHSARFSLQDFIFGDLVSCSGTSVETRGLLTAGFVE